MPNLKEIVILVWLIAGLLALSIGLRAKKLSDDSIMIASYSDGQFHYTCSKLVAARYHKFPQIAESGVGSYIPNNKNEARAYCRMDGIY